MANEKRDQLQSLGLPVYWSSTNNQTGNGFGEKISNSIQEVFDLGFEKIIVVGNDCPLLDKAMLRKAIHQLCHNDVVIGPDMRGGVYLLGVSKTCFHKSEVAQLPWQTPNLASALKTYFHSLQVVPVVLKPLSDINQSVDLFFINRSGLKSNNVLRFIHDLLHLISYNFSRTKRVLNDILPASVGLRAPPLTLS